MPRDLGIADRLRKAGLNVVEQPGWRVRGNSDFNPKGSVNHHTAAGGTASTPSLDYITSGSSIAPLANVMQSRERDQDDKFYVIASGRANHAGKGSWRGLSGNSSVYGLEIEHDGTSVLSIERQRLAARCHAAMLLGINHPDPNNVCQHREWAPDRKIDAAQGVNANWFRAMVAQNLGQAPPKPPVPGVTGGAMEVAMHPSGKGYYIVASDGGVFSFGEAPFFGSLGGQTLNKPITGMAVRPQGDGYILCGADGGVFAFGAAQFLGSLGNIRLNAPIVDIEFDAEGDGYWMLGADGGIFTFGSANYHGSAAGHIT
jgi:hypothetical protein